jgi:uncharacterized protein
VPLKLKVLRDRFTISLVNVAPAHTDQWSTIHDHDGWTVIESSPTGEWNAIQIDQEFELDEIGILLQLLQPLAIAKIPVMAYSTYKTDYVFINSKLLSKAVQSLKEAGHEVSQA